MFDPEMMYLLSNSTTPGAFAQAGQTMQGYAAQQAAAQQAHEQQMVQQAQALGERLAMDEAARSPYVQNLIGQATAPVSAFNPEEPMRGAVPTREDIGTLQRGMPPMPGGPGQSPTAFPMDKRVEMTVGEPYMVPKYEKGGQLIPYDNESAFSDAPPKLELSKRTGVSSVPPKSKDSTMPRNASELKQGENLLKEVVDRRKTEETSRRALQVEDLKGKGKARDTQLVMAAKLLMNLRDNQTKMAVAMERAKAIMNKPKKTGQDLKILKDGWQLARSHSDAAKSAVSDLYQAGAASAPQDTPEFANYKAALDEAQRSERVMAEWERAYTDASKSMTGKPAASGGAQKMRFDAQGNLVPG